jgi:SAM-dependent methyltransferase
MHNKEVVISEDRIQLVDNDGMLNNGIVMDKIAKDITEVFCKVVHTPKARILDVGFGLGYSANKFLELGVESYTVIEINKQIYDKAIEWAKDKPNVTVLMGDWYDVIPELKLAGKKFDGIFMDTYGDLSDKYALFESYCVGIAEQGCVLSIYEYPSFKKWGELNGRLIKFDNTDDYPLRLKDGHTVCWTYFAAGEFRKEKFFENHRNVLSPELCAKLIDENQDSYEYQEATATIDNIVHSRSYYSSKVRFNKELEDIINKTIFKRFKPRKMEDLYIRIYKYDVGDKYDRHVESRKGMPIDDPEQFVDTYEIALNDIGTTRIFDDWRRNNRETFSTIPSTSGNMLEYKTYQHVTYMPVEEGTRYQLLIYLKNNDYIKHPI